MPTGCSEVASTHSVSNPAINTNRMASPRRDIYLTICESEMMAHFEQMLQLIRRRLPTWNSKEIELAVVFKVQ